MFKKLPSTFESFYDSILFHSLSSLKLNLHLDNFDTIRFNYDGTDHSKDFNVKNHVFYFDWFFKNAAPLFNAYSFLNNESSKRLYLYIIAYRLGGHLSVKIPVDFANKDEELKAYRSIASRTPSQLPTSGMFGKLSHFDFEYENHRYIADSLGFEYYLFRRQYFYNKEGVSIAPELGDSIIDGGACTGESTLVFSNVVGPCGLIYAFDPVKEHLDILTHNIARYPYKNIKIMPFGLSNKSIDAEPIILGKYSPGFRTQNQHVPLRSIDSLVKTEKISKLNFIKLDVEGSEMDSLLGAEQSINRFKPKLAISLYHKPNDFFEIILYIKNKFPFYSCYLNHYTIHNEETVLYCKV